MAVVKREGGPGRRGREPASAPARDAALTRLASRPSLALRLCFFPRPCFVSFLSSSLSRLPFSLVLASSSFFIRACFVSLLSSSPRLSVPRIAASCSRFCLFFFPRSSSRLLSLHTLPRLRVSLSLGLASLLFTPCLSLFLFTPCLSLFHFTPCFASLYASGLTSFCPRSLPRLHVYLPHALLPSLSVATPCLSGPCFVTYFSRLLLLRLVCAVRLASFLLYRALPPSLAFLSLFFRPPLLPSFLASPCLALSGD